MVGQLKNRLAKILIERFLSRRGITVTLDSEDDFLSLQRSYNGVPEYGYDDFSTWKRAAQRTIYMLEDFDLRTKGLKILEAGCGRGMLGVLFNSYGHYIDLVDFEDWRDARAKSLPYYNLPLENLSIIESEQYDFICSFNSFEHVVDPAAALGELIRVCKPGGKIYLDFGPLYSGPWGLHAYRTIKMPYPQFLFSEAYIQTKLNELGVNDLGRVSNQLQPINKWKYAEFVSLWEKNSKVRCVFQNRVINEQFLNIILRYPRAFQGRRLSYIDLTTQGIQVLLRKL